LLQPRTRRFVRPPGRDRRRSAWRWRESRPLETAAALDVSVRIVECARAAESRRPGALTA
jgi:hypothetical protein